LAQKNRTDLDIARDELMSHIHRCGVLKASPEQQDIWLEDTMQFMAERYTQLTEPELKQLHEIGKRFCQPVIANQSSGRTDASAAANEGEMAGAA
jgi:hypothetical protein